jgi:hypothetical protein
VFKSTTPEWGETNDLKHTRHESKKEDKITLFKQLTIGNVLGRVYPTTDRLPQGANNDPLKFELYGDRFWRSVLLENAIGSHACLA